MTQALKHFVANPPPGVDKKEVLKYYYRLNRYIEKQIRIEEEKSRLNSLLEKTKADLQEILDCIKLMPDTRTEALNDALQIIQRLKFDLLKIKKKSKLEKNYFEICRSIRELFNQIPAHEKYLLYFFDEKGEISKKYIKNLRIGVPDGAKECKLIFDKIENNFFKIQTLNIHKALKLD